jgi:Zn-dependent protease
MFYLISSNLQFGLSYFFMLILAISVHEMAHAWMAHKRGDDTAALMGRMTINPMVHFDPVGFLFILFMPFGWGKPVPFNPMNLRDVKKDSMLIALAGPVSNIIQASILAVLFRLLEVNIVYSTLVKLPGGEKIIEAMALVFVCGVMINLLLAFFNMIPLFPLDGEKILAGVLPREQEMKLYDFRKHSMMVLMGIIMIGYFLNIHILSYYFHLTAFPVIKLMIGFLPFAF